MKIISGFLLLLASLSVSADTLQQHSKHDSGYAWELIQQGAQLVDVRTPAEYQDETISQALNIPLDTLPQQLAILDKSRPVVVYCRSGRRSSLASDYLRQQGYQVYDAGTYQLMAVK